MSLLATTVRPGLRYGGRPERQKDAYRWLSRIDAYAYELIGKVCGNGMSFSSFNRNIRKPLLARIKEISACSQTELSALIKDLRYCRSAQGRALEALALAAVQSRMTLGLAPHVEQLYAVWAMRHGHAVDMQTGEGKSLSAALTAVTVALEGTPVHVVTVNEYLVARDAVGFQPLFEAFDLRVAALSADQTDHERRMAYACDIVYVTGKQLAFDYLRDRVAGNHAGGALTQQLRSLLPGAAPESILRGLCFAIVDEIDSVLVDEARTPLVLAVPSATDNVARDRSETVVALGIARLLHADVDFLLHRDNRSVELTTVGLSALQQLAERFDGVWKVERYRTERVRQALIALHLFQREHDYIVRDGRVLLVDESTGRIMPDRRLQHGLHRILEVHERVELTPENEVRTAISFQDFFARYQALAGMSGSVHQIRSELFKVYRLKTVSVPTHKKSLQIQHTARLFATQPDQLRALVHEAISHQERGQPLLVGTRSIQQSEVLSALLRARKVEHRVLNAMQDQDEAGKIALAGQSGAVTIATNMAGRGSDIALGEVVAQAGGLSVIALSINDSSRIDRQLFGRAARQGKPGCGQQWLALDDEQIAENMPAWFVGAVKRWLHCCPSHQALTGRLICSLVQSRIERRHAKQRLSMMKNIPRLERHLAIGGK